MNILAGTVAIGVANLTNSYLGTGTVTLGDSSGNNNATLYVSAASNGTGVTNAIVVAAGTTGTLTIAGNNSSINLSGPIALNNNLTLTNANTGKIINFLGVTTCANSTPLTIASASGNTGPNTFSGGVVIGSGGLNFANNSTKTLTLGPGNVTGSGSLTNSGIGTNTTISGSLGSSIGNIVQNSTTSALILSGANSAFSNNVFINVGTLTASGATSLNAANLVTISTGGILDMQNSLSIAGLQDGSGAGTVTNASITARTMTLTGSGNYSFGGAIADGANGGARVTTLVKDGNGTQTLSGANTYTGTTTVSNGTLLVNGLIGTNAVTVNNGATLGGRGTIGGLVNIAANAILSPSLGLGGSNTLTVSSTATNALTLSGGNGNLVFALSTNATALTNDQIKIAGALVLNGANTIAISFPVGLAPAGIYTLMTYAATNGSGTLALNGSYLNTALAVTSTNVQLIVSSSTNSSLTWQGQNNGTWDTTTTNWNSGGSLVNFANGSQVTFDDTASRFAVTNSGVSPATVTLNNSLNNYTFTSSGGGISGSTGLTKYGTGTLTLNGANSFSGDTIINGGSVVLGNALALAGSKVAVNVANGLGFAVNAVTVGNLVGSGSFALNNSGFPVSLTLGGNNASTIYSGNLTGAGSLIKTGSGVFTLTGNDMIGGTTTVSNGTLAINGTLAASALNVFGGTLAGSGTVTGSVTVGAGGTLFPTANWIINGAVNLGAGSTTVMQLGTTATMVRGVGTLTYGGTLMITNTTGASLVAGSSFKLFDATTYSGAFASSNLPTLGAGLSWYLNDLTNYGTLRVVPDWSVAGVFNSNMVLQRGIPMPVWGTALPGQSVTVTFGGQTKTTTAVADRKWLVRLDAMAANTNSQNLTITIAGSTTNTYTNVLVGEVWLAAGQSNMVLPLQSMTNATAEIASANYPLMRRFAVPNANGGSIMPVWQISSTPWEICSPTTAPNWSGAAYFFARNLFANLNVPIGILQSAVNGTTAESRTSFEALEAVPELKTMADQQLEQYYQGNAVIGSTATGLFNTMIWPLIPFGIRGAIYYQGEANSATQDRCQQYRVLLPTMIQDWRSRWQQADFPFYIVQLPNYSSMLWPYLREAQMLTLQTVTNTGLAVIIDVGDPTVLHPTDKQDVGARLANLALNRNYGFTNVVASGPIFRTYAIEGGQIRLYFDYADGGLMIGQKNGLASVQELVGVAPLWFEIAGTNQTYYPATAYIDTNNTVVVSSPSVPNPTLARYAWTANPQGTNLYNRAGLPASPFRIPAWTNAPPIASLQLNGGNMQSACVVPTNVTWWVEFNDNLAGTSWTPMVLPQTGTGAVQTVTEPINGRAQRFYHWRQLP